MYLVRNAASKAESPNAEMSTPENETVRRTAIASDGDADGASVGAFVVGELKGANPKP